VGVLPKTSMISQCQTNVSSVPTTITQITTQYAAADYHSMLTAVRDLTLRIDGAIFNCYFTVTSPVVAADYSNGFSLSLLIWNILFNLGFMYTAVKGILMFLWLDPPATPTDADFTEFGGFIGSFLMRFIYSNYVPKSYYPF